MMHKSLYLFLVLILLSGNMACNDGGTGGGGVIVGSDQTQEGATADPVIGTADLIFGVAQHLDNTFVASGESLVLIEANFQVEQVLIQTAPSHCATRDKIQRRYGPYTIQLNQEDIGPDAPAFVTSSTQLCAVGLYFEQDLNVAPAAITFEWLLNDETTVVLQISEQELLLQASNLPISLNEATMELALVFPWQDWVHFAIHGDLEPDEKGIISITAQSNPEAYHDILGRIGFSVQQ